MTTWYPPSREASLMAIRYAAIARTPERAIEMLEHARGAILKVGVPTEPTLLTLERALAILKTWQHDVERRKERTRRRTTKERT